MNGTTPSFAVTRIDDILLSGPDELKQSDLMSPYVWQTDEGAFQILVRVVSRAGEHTGRIWFGEGEDGLHFDMDDTPLLQPGPDMLDIRGCEDPTFVAASPDVVVYYTGLDREGSGQMLWASGPTIREIKKRGVALRSTKTQRNTKEAEIAFLGDEWVLIYEYSEDEASKIGHAHGSGPAGPWTEIRHPFDARPGSWDDWHLSPGPMLLNDIDYPVMFYNGATHDAAWNIGWVIFDRRANSIAARCVEPLLRADWVGDGGKIAFAASLLEQDGNIQLYLSRGDATLHRATVKRGGAS